MSGTPLVSCHSLPPASPADQRCSGTDRHLGNCVSVGGEGGGGGGGRRRRRNVEGVGVWVYVWVRGDWYVREDGGEGTHIIMQWSSHSSIHYSKHCIPA